MNGFSSSLLPGKKTAALFLGSALWVGATALAVDPNPSALLQEFFRRDKLRMTPQQAQSIQFLKDLKFPTENIEELEVLDSDGRFVLRNRDDQVCLGSPTAVLLRCKNRMGLTTVTFQGDAD